MTERIMDTYNNHLSNGEFNELIKLFDATGVKLDFSRQAGLINELFNKLGSASEREGLLRACGLEDFINEVPLEGSADLVSLINDLRKTDSLKSEFGGMLKDLRNNFNKIFYLLLKSDFNESFYNELSGDLQKAYYSLLSNPSSRMYQEYLDEDFNEARFLINVTGVGVSEETADKLFNHYFKLDKYKNPYTHYSLKLIEITGRLPSKELADFGIDWALKQSLVNSYSSEYCGHRSYWTKIELGFVKDAVELCKLMGRELSDELKLSIMSKLNSTGAPVREYPSAYKALSRILSYNPGDEFFNNPNVINICKKDLDSFDKLRSEFNIEFEKSFYNKVYKSLFDDIMRRGCFEEDNPVKSLFEVINYSRYDIEPSDLKKLYTDLMKSAKFDVINQLDDELNVMPEFTNEELPALKEEVIYGLVSRADLRRSCYTGSIEKSLKWFEERISNIEDSVYNNVYKKLLNSGKNADYILEMIRVLSDYSGIKADYMALLK